MFYRIVFFDFPYFFPIVIIFSSTFLVLSSISLATLKKIQALAKIYMFLTQKSSVQLPRQKKNDILFVYFLLFFQFSFCDFFLPKTSRQLPRKHPKNSPKTFRNFPKTFPQTSPKLAKNLPKTSQMSNFKN